MQFVLPNEPDRLHAHQRYAILDTPPDLAFDRITTLAARLLRTPFALVTLVDQHRLWFKSRYSLTVTEAPRKAGFCAQTITGDELLEIRDTHAEPFYATSPLIMGESFIRFYAGVPLRSPDGYAVGSTFAIELQLAEAPLSRLERMGMLSVLPAAPDASAHTVVYVEDTLSKGTLIERILLQRPGMTLLPAMQGRTGLNLVLLNLHLPDMLGHDVLRTLHADPRTAHILVLVLSADAIPSPVDRLLADGAVAYTTKPFDVHYFLQVLDATLQREVP